MLHYSELSVEAKGSWYQIAWSRTYWSTFEVYLKVENISFLEVVEIVYRVIALFLSQTCPTANAFQFFLSTNQRRPPEWLHPSNRRRHHYLQEIYFRHHCEKPARILKTLGSYPGKLFVSTVTTPGKDIRMNTSSSKLELFNLVPGCGLIYQTWMTSVYLFQIYHLTFKDLFWKRFRKYTKYIRVCMWKISVRIWEFDHIITILAYLIVMK